MGSLECVCPGSSRRGMDAVKSRRAAILYRRVAESSSPVKDVRNRTASFRGAPWVLHSSSDGGAPSRHLRCLLQKGGSREGTAGDQLQYQQCALVLSIHTKSPPPQYFVSDQQLTAKPFIYQAPVGFKRVATTTKFMAPMCLAQRCSNKCRPHLNATLSVIR